MFFTNSTELLNLERIPPSPETPLTDVVLHPSIFLALRTNQKNTVNYLAGQIPNLLDYAFKDVSSAESTSSFEILLLMIPQITQALIDHCLFYKFASNLLLQKLPDPIVGRLSYLTLKLLCSSMKGALDSCGFILQLFQYSDNTSVTNLFANLMENTSELISIQRWLINRDITSEIIHSLNKIQFDNVSQTNFSSIENQKLCSLFQIIRAAFNNPITRPSFTNDKILNLISINQEFICYVEDQRWKTVLSLLSNKNKTVNLKPFIGLANQFIMKDFNQVHQYHCFIIDFLCKTMNESYEPQLYHHLFKLMQTFSECSLLHLSILAFFEKALDKKCIDEIDIQMIGNQVFQEVQYTQLGSVFHATTMKLFSVFVKNGKKNKKVKKSLEKISGFYGYANNQHKSYKKVISKRYGNRSSKRFSLFKSSQ